MFRKQLIEFLLDHPHSVAEIAHEMDMTPRDVEDDLKHLLRSSKHGEYHAILLPARCRQCGFTFRKDKLRKPGKCPRCKHTWIQEPRLSFEKTP